MSENPIPASVVGETVTQVAKRSWKRPILAIGAAILAAGAAGAVLVSKTRNPSDETN